MNTIKIKGEEYPCMMTMGAMLRFKEKTGREVTQMDGTGLSDMITLLWCCVESACKRTNHPFDMSLMDMADSIDQTDFEQWQSQSFEPVQDDAARKAGKKKA